MPSSQATQKPGALKESDYAVSPINTRNYGNLLHALYAWDYVLEPWGIQGKLGLEGT